ncbi:MAG: SCP2 sterol-binding domain-containing protein [Lachnospiraceae bacterium]|nr:SCP2 sterol-binding domain-containing protein [Ruminococcus sp.]MCM1273994.1 SCP2 sterol-binding domain-containing protein [Lachnospiraceae bacterium]
MSIAKKPAEKKAAAQTTADKKTTAKEAAAVKTEVKSAAVKTAAKSTLRKTAAPKAKKSADTKANSKSSAKTTGATGTSAKTAAKATAKKAPAKRAAKKSDTITIDTICGRLEKKLGKKTVIKEKLAVDIEVWGFEDGSNRKMYVEVNDGKITVSPHTYDEKDFRVSLSFANAVAFVDGKLSLKALIESKDFYAEGNIAAAVKLAAIF